MELTLRAFVFARTAGDGHNWRTLCKANQHLGGDLSVAEPGGRDAMRLLTLQRHNRAHHTIMPDFLEENTNWSPTLSPSSPRSTKVSSSRTETTRIVRCPSSSAEDPRAGLTAPTAKATTAIAAPITPNRLPILPPPLRCHPPQMATFSISTAIGT
jgi:hypothetical protein